MTMETETKDTETKSPGTTESTTSSRNGAFARALADMVAVGVGWAQYGLAMGRQSLQVSAKTLESTAKLLEGVSERLSTARDSQPKP
jgi:trimethylamine:corrinoid methyltransferase-like protein